MKKWKIICCSPARTASTVLSNSIYGMITPNEPLDLGNGPGDITKDIIITHKIDINNWINKFKDDNIDLYFISSERKGYNKFIDSQYYEYSNVAVIQFEELLETDTHSVEDIIDVIFSRVRNMLPDSIILNKETAVQRIKNMNTFYSTIKDKPFDYYDLFYHIHGSHRKRGGRDL